MESKRTVDKREILTTLCPPCGGTGKGIPYGVGASGGIAKVLTHPCEYCQGRGWQIIKVLDQEDDGRHTLVP